MDVAIDITVTCQTWQDDLPDAATLVEAAARAAVAMAPPSATGAIEVSIVLADDEMVHHLNRQYRDKDKPTNVLSFPNDDASATVGEPALLGDVVLAHGVVTRETAAQGKTLAAHLSHLVVHGVLHLLGQDHETDDEAQAMEATETAVLRQLGFDDPYAPRAGAPI